jgi:hypothetical protein
MRSSRAFAVGALAVLSMGGVAAAQDRVPACAPPGPAHDGWRASYIAGCVDRGGRFAGGSQLMHLVRHKGLLYAANGYWLDRRNPVYGGADPGGPWAQVLRLGSPTDAWTVDLELGPRHMRTELLTSVTFTQDAAGRALGVPQTLLLAATYDGHGARGISVFVRDDEDGSWSRGKVLARPTGQRGEDNSVRAAAVYRDRVTGREQLFLSVGVLGLFTGRYEGWRPGRIRWSEAPEAGTASASRILSIVEADDALYFAEGARIVRRIDGPVPRYVTLLDLSADVPEGTDRSRFQSIGGIRGLTAIEGPVPGKRSLIFVWHPGPRRSDGLVVRLDPRPDGGWTRVDEVRLAELASSHLGGAPVSFVLGAYSAFTPLRAPVAGDTLHLVGLEAFIPSTPEGRAFQHLTTPQQRGEQGGFYGGALYAIRDGQGRWRIGEVNGRYAPGRPSLVSVYTLAPSPFGGTDRGTVYVGGYDPNHYPPASDTAWVYATDIGALLRDAAGP